MIIIIQVHKHFQNHNNQLLSTRNDLCVILLLYGV